MYKICFFVPPENAEAVKNAIFEAGGGRIGNYESCSWETHGIGQFKPMPGSNPKIGEIETLARVEELKVELVCSDEFLAGAILALKQAHPYEEPAYEVIKMVEL